MLDDRAKLLLKALVERYIADGQPVGSRTLSRATGIELSPATIRNVMSDLEGLGLIASPHTSAGRIPTARGYRLFVDTMLTADRGHLHAPSLAPDQPQKVIANAAHLLSDLSQFVGVVIAPKRSSVFRHIEFLRLSDRRLLVIIVSPDGEVVTMVHFNARDLINHKGWKEVRKQKTADDVVADDDAADQAGQGVESKEVHEELQGLRDMLTEAGVKVDARWGKKRLMEEIEKASRIDPVEDEQDAA